MASEPKYEEVNAEYFKSLAPAQVAVEARMQPETDARIAKILTISTNCEIVSFEPLDGEVRYSGRVNFKVLFIDIEGATGSMDYNADFTDKILDKVISPSSELFMEAAILDTDTVSVTQTDLKLSVAVEVRCKAMASEKVNYIKEGTEDIYTQTEELSFDTISSRASDSFYVTEEFEPKDNVVNVLLCEAVNIPTEVKCGLDCVIFSGMIDLNVIYTAENGLIKNENFSVDYSQECKSMGAKIDDRVVYMMKISGFSILLTDDIGSERKIIKGDFSLHAEAKTLTEVKTVAVVDAFSVAKEIKITGESITTPKFVECVRLDEKVEGTAALGENLPSIDKVICVTSSRAQLANIFNEGNKLTLEGVINTSIIYWNNEYETRNSVSVELPYSVTVKCDLPEEKLSFDGNAYVLNISARPRKNNEVELNATVKFCVNVYTEKVGYFLKEIEISGTKVTRETAIAVYITREGEKLWDVAKALCTTPQNIMAQNPELKEPMPAGERILIYRQISADL